MGVETNAGGPGIGWKDKPKSSRRGPCKLPYGVLSVPIFAFLLHSLPPLAFLCLPVIVSHSQQCEDYSLLVLSMSNLIVDGTAEGKAPA